MSARQLEALAGDELSRADELLDRANHDIAKYMTLTARNVDPEAMEFEEQVQLLEDLLHTDGEHAAWELWSPLYRELEALASDIVLVSIDDGMATIRELVGQHDPQIDQGGALVKAVVDVADRIAGLRRAVRRRLMEGSR